MDAPQEDKPMTVAMFETYLERFIDNMRYSRDLDSRWLGDHLKETLRAVRQVRTGKLDPEYKKLALSFRASEIEDDLSKKRRDVGQLERDLAAVQKQMA